MAQPFEILVYVHRLQASEKEAVFAQDAAFPSSSLRTSLLEAVEDVCLDRLIRADGCLQLVQHCCRG